MKGGIDLSAAGIRPIDAERLLAGIDQAAVLSKFARLGISACEVQIYIQAVGRSCLTDADAARWENDRRELRALREGTGQSH